MHLGREEHAQASKTRPELDSSTFAGWYRGALTVVEPTDKRLVVGRSPSRSARPRRRRGSNPGRISVEATPVGDLSWKQPRSGVSRKSKIFRYAVPYEHVTDIMPVRI